MSKTIRVSEAVYSELEQIREKRETFSDLVARLLKARPHVREDYSLVGGVARFQQWQRDQQQARDTQGPSYASVMANERSS